MSGLPQWLANPITISSSLDDSTDKRLENMDLDVRLQAALRSQDIETLFPIQEAVMRYVNSANDICVCAPTGSGKTLAYALPIVQALRKRHVVRLRALIVVPGRELATQVLSVMERLTGAVGLKVGLSLGQTSVSSEAKGLISYSSGGSLVDILISTPGRLVDHLETTRGFTLQHVEWLILDEADRLLEGFTQEWLPQVLASLYTKSADVTGSITYRFPEDTPFDSTFWVTPLRKMLFSATLTKNPAKLVELNLNDPIYIAVLDMNGQKYLTPKELEEYLYVCEEEWKPVPLIHLLQNGLTHSLCFAKSVDTADKLRILLNKSCPLKRIATFSSELSSKERAEVLCQFNNGSIDVLICSDIAARGLDLQNVLAVINYDAPKHSKTYIHRVGRTARAGKGGRAYTILAIKEAHHFKKMIGKLGKPKLSSLRIPQTRLKTIVSLLEDTLSSFKSHKSAELE